MTLKAIGIAATILGLVSTVFLAGMAWQDVRNTDAQQDEAIRAIKHVLVSEHPDYTLNLYPEEGPR